MIRLGVLGGAVLSNTRVLKNYHCLMHNFFCSSLRAVSSSHGIQKKKIHLEPMLALVLYTLVSVLVY